MTTNGKNTISAFASVLSDMRINQTKTETAIGKLIVAVYEMEATFSAEKVKIYFAKEAADRKDMQNDILASEDDTFAKELKFIDHYRDMEKDDRTKQAVEYETVIRRHNYLRGEFHKAMTALAFLRYGGKVDGINCQPIVKVAQLKGGRFTVYFPTEEQGVIEPVRNLSSRALINAGSHTLEGQGLRKKKGSSGTNTNHVSVGSNVAANIDAFKSNLDVALAKQTEELRKLNPQAIATIHDLGDELEEKILEHAKSVIRRLWVHDGTIDIHDAEMGLKSLGFTVTSGKARKVA